MATVQKISEEQRLVLSGVSWEEYSRLLRVFAKRRGIRLTYDRGALEIMTLSLKHESLGRFFDYLILALALHFGLPFRGGGSTTFRRRRSKRGLEPDECYWIANEALVRGKDRIDLRSDPPPDIALEIEVSQSMLNRMKLYAALRLPEIWRCDGETLKFYFLDPEGRYIESQHSKAIPQLISSELASLLPIYNTMDDGALFRHFQTWAMQKWSRTQP